MSKLGLDVPALTVPDTRHPTPYKSGTIGDMSEIFIKNLNALTVSEVEPQSPAARAGVQTGDLIKEINGRTILDILDYRFHSSESKLRVLLERNGETLTKLLRKSEIEDAGLSFESDLGDKIHTCKNKCVFCFIHQQPKKMRKSLYLMDDDFRLSFMHGNYVTLTNLSKQEWDRILEQRLSPLYVSVHSTDPVLRARLLGRPEPTPILEQIRELADHGIDIHAQIVLCPGMNDGEHLDRTLEELSREHRSSTGKRSGVPSVAIVPVGLTRFRERLPNLSTVERDYALAMIEHIRQIEKKFIDKLGTRFAWLADEWYYIAGKPFPGKSHYEEFPQLEDGIGTVRLFMEGAKRVSTKLPKTIAVPITATLVTAKMPSQVILKFADRLNAIEGVDINVCVIENEFFGKDIHIAGLLTAQDILSQVANFTERKELIYIPEICLRDGNLFLDDITLEEARQSSGLDIRAVGNSPVDLAKALGLMPSSNTSNNDKHHWMMESE